MIQSIYFIAGDSGDVLLEKHYRGIISRAAVETFWEEVSKRAKRDDVPPILLSTKYYLCNIYREGVYVLALMTGEMPVLLVLEFLHRVFDVYKSYWGAVTPKTITDNFSGAYQLLEEMLDNGYPMITEPNALNSLIAPPSLAGAMAKLTTGKSAVSETIGEGAMSIIPWRKSGASYTNNELFFDVCEEIDCIVEPNGSVVANDVRGSVLCTCRMSGTPDLTLIFANPNIIEDCSFHPCVRYARYERESVVSFVPPDGAFQLMTYRVVDRAPATPLYCRPSVTWREGSARVSFVVGSKPMASRSAAVRTSSGGISSSSGGGGAGAGGVAGTDGPGAEDIVLRVTFPRAVRTVDLTSDVGHVHIDPSTNALTWTIGRYPSTKLPELVGNIHLAGGCTTPPIEAVSATLHFTVPGTTVSGLAVKDVVLSNEKYKFFKGVKTLVKTGRYQVRT